MDQSIHGIQIFGILYGVVMDSFGMTDLLKIGGIGKWQLYKVRVMMAMLN